MSYGAADALETNDSAVQVLGGEKLRVIAREPVEAVRRNTSIDWTMRENRRAQIHVMVKRILRKYGYQPDLQADDRDGTQTGRTAVLGSRHLSGDWRVRRDRVLLASDSPAQT
jgi:hypothetical protein